MDYEFENICKFDETIIEDFFKLRNKQRNVFKNHLLSTYITWALLTLFALLTIGILASIIIFSVGVILLYIAFAMGNKKQIKKYLETCLKLWPTGEAHYIFENDQYGAIDGRKLKYEVIDSVVFSEKLTYFSIGNMISIFPQDGFRLNNYEDFQEFIIGKIESNKIRYIL